MPKGSKPGERRGGRQRGVPNKRTQEQLELARLEAEAQKAADKLGLPSVPRKKLAKEVLEDFMFAFSGIASFYNNRVVTALQAAAMPTKSDMDALEKWGSLTVGAASELANYQSPKYRALVVSMTPGAGGDQPRPGDDAKIIDNVHELKDPVALERVYKRMIQQVG